MIMDLPYIWSALQVKFYKDDYIGAHDEVYHQTKLPETFRMKCCFLISRKLPTLHRIGLTSALNNF